MIFMDKMPKFLRNPIPVILTGLLLLLPACDRMDRYERSGFAFDTIVNITVYSSDKTLADRALSDAFTLSEHYDKLLSISDPESEIYRLNHADGNAVTVSADTYSLLEKAIGYAEMSDGLLDVTIQPLYALWDFTGEDHDSLPDENAIASAKEKVDYRNIRLLGENRVQLSGGAMINLGAIAKGYIADRIKEQLLADGITSALINLGGNVVAIGQKEGGTPFAIGLATPFDPSGKIIDSVSVSDRSVVTSGIYQRYFEYDGRIYHHIIDPVTGYPADNDLNAATVIASSSTDADAYSTICMLLGKEKAKAFIAGIPDTEVILIDRNNRVFK